MKRLAFATFLLLGACAPQFVHAPDRSASAVAPTPRGFPALQAFADAVVRDGRVPSISIAVGVGDEPTTYISAGRVTLDAGAPTVDQDTLWRVYSMTKPITGIAAMILVDEGKLRLDQPIGDFIPAFRTSRVLVDVNRSLETRPASRPVTVRDLMTHTSGLNYGVFGNSPAVEELKRNGVLPFQFNRSTEAEVRALRPTSLQEFADRAARSGLVADPGTRFSYSMGLDVLGAVIEKASGMSFPAFVQRKLFNPLKMHSSYWQVPKAEAGRLVTTYAPVSTAKVLPVKGIAAANDHFVAIDPAATSVYLDPPSFAYGGAGLVMSASDYDRFLHMLQNDGQLDGVRVLSPATARLARSNLLPPGVVLKGFGPLPANEGAGFGAGGFSTTLEVNSLGMRRGTYGWDGAAGTRAWVDAARRVRATMMINAFAPIGPDFDNAVAADLAASNVK